MSGIRALMIGSMFALSSTAACALAAPAGMPAAFAGMRSQAIDVAMICDDYGCRPDRPFRQDGTARRDRPDRRPDRSGWQDNSGNWQDMQPNMDIDPEVFMDPEYYRPRAPKPVRPVFSRHIDWCKKRYSSYDPSTNEYRGSDNSREECHSPYGG